MSDDHVNNFLNHLIRFMFWHKMMCSPVSAEVNKAKHLLVVGCSKNK